ncbi:hypothetical protein G7062_00445 [Erysipelothrix sp. HDW6C]|uniref:hypothetical protein n=1 Tax=Erysipelothrix sp. HDW6C TaxID=2714930 RepID=UPI00140820E8|nr:hypothetical protein [Erysipelothrix sp. HDW6C]QIK68844.1 hypothetical protein G7062_00445 [Erysipelothrix sp. HDW6C]
MKLKNKRLRLQLIIILILIPALIGTLISLFLLPEEFPIITHVFDVPESMKQSIIQTSIRDLRIFQILMPFAMIFFNIMLFTGLYFLYSFLRNRFPRRQTALKLVVPDDETHDRFVSTYNRAFSFVQSHDQSVKPMNYYFSDIDEPFTMSLNKDHAALGKKTYSLENSDENLYVTLIATLLRQHSNIGKERVLFQASIVMLIIDIYFSTLLIPYLDTVIIILVIYTFLCIILTLIQLKIKNTTVKKWLTLFCKPFTFIFTKILSWVNYIIQPTIVREAYAVDEQMVSMGLGDELLKYLNYSMSFENKDVPLSVSSRQRIENIEKLLH